MSLTIDDTEPTVSYTVGAAQTAFTVPFTFFADADLVVEVTVGSTTTTKTLTTDYTVTGAEVSGGGSVTFLVALTSCTVTITRTIDLARTTNFPAAGPFEIDDLNLELDRLVAMIQQVSLTQVRALIQPTSDTATIGRLPAKATRASAYLAFDANGDPLAAADPAAYPASTFMATVLDDLTAAAARATLGITDQSSYTGIANYRVLR